jgi:hypothetical protein
MILRLNKVLLIALLGFFTLIVIILLVLLNLPKNQIDNSQIPIPTIVPIEDRGNSSIKINSINPPEDIAPNTAIRNPSQIIEYSLSDTSLSINDLTVRADPPLPLKIKIGQKPGTFEVFPDPPDFWKPEQLYTVTLLDKQGKTITTYQIKVPLYKVQEVVD